jgi:hypothetical protein
MVKNHLLLVVLRCMFFIYVCCCSDGICASTVINDKMVVLRQLSSLEIDGSPVAVSVDKNYAYVTTYAYNNGLKIFDVSDPNNPNLVGSINLGEHARGVVKKGDYVYVANGWGYSSNGGLRIIDVSSPANPVLVGGITSGDNTYAQTLDVVGDYAYVADGADGGCGGLKIINVIDPTNPVLVGVFVDVTATTVKVVGNYAYILDGDFKIIDISDPTNPYLVGSLETDGCATGLDIAGNYAYVTDQNKGLKIIDIRNPINPILLSHIDTSGCAYDVVVYGHYAYVGNLDEGIRIVDVADPLSPVIIGSYNEVGHICLAAISIDNYLMYVPDGSLKILQIQDGGMIAYYPFDGNPKDMGLYGNDGTARNVILAKDRSDIDNSSYCFSDGSYIIANNTQRFNNIRDALSVFAWINPSSTYYPGIIVSKWDDYAQSHSFIFKLDNDGSGRLNIELSKGEHNDLIHLHSATPVSSNMWSHVGMVFNKTDVNIYINGLSDVRGSVTGGNISNSTSDLSIGAVKLGNGVYGEFFNGMIDQVSIFNIALSADEVYRLYADNIAFSSSSVKSDEKRESGFKSSTINSSTLPTSNEDSSDRRSSPLPSLSQTKTKNGYSKECKLGEFCNGAYNESI